jgi:phosphoglycerate kinase
MKGKPRVVGFLVERELRFLGSAVADPKRPFVCILGGAKVSDKIGVIRSLSEKCDAILVGGAMAYTFLAQAGQQIGRSLVEPDLFDTAQQLRQLCGDRLHLPTDSVASSGMSDSDGAADVGGDIPAAMMGLDIGPKTIAAYRDIIEQAKTVLWSGPMGVFESPPFDKGTLAVAQAMSAATRKGATTIVGGGDSAAAIRQAGLQDEVTHISTGGGASLEFLEGKSFAAIDVLDDA